MNSLDIAGLLFSAAIFGPLAYIAATEGSPALRDVIRDARDFAVPEKREKVSHKGSFAEA